MLSAQLSRFDTYKGPRSGQEHVQPEVPMAVLDNLFDATEGTENVKLHFNVRWQKEKDRVVHSMASSLQTYKPTIALTQTQMNRKLQGQTDHHAGQKQLQQLLTQQFGLQNVSSYDVPKPCQAVLSEAPFLRQEKIKKDQHYAARSKSLADKCLM